jgi:hypothetical protein
MAYAFLQTNFDPNQVSLEASRQDVRNKNSVTLGPVADSATGVSRGSAARSFDRQPSPRGAKIPICKRCWRRIGLRHRFIPAGAGNTMTTLGVSSRWTVHPRRRGEHIPAVNQVLLSLGSSRWRWEHLKRQPAAGVHTGSSPQARGTAGGGCAQGFALLALPASTADEAGVHARAFDAASWPDHKVPRARMRRRTHLTLISSGLMRAGSQRSGMSWCHGRAAVPCDPFRATVPGGRYGGQVSDVHESFRVPTRSALVSCLLAPMFQPCALS